MKVFSEINLSSFEFWAGAKDNASKLTYDELEQLEYVLEDIYEGEIEDVTINDIMWFDFAWVCEAVGLAYDEDKDEVIREIYNEE